MGFFIFLIMQQIMNGVVAQIKTLEGFCKSLVTRIKTMNNDMIKLDTAVSAALGLPPDLDRIARAGVRFDSVYCTYPLCTPSRDSMFTGMMPHQIGIDGNEQTIPTMYQPYELGNILSLAGYECAYGGKWHVPEISIGGGHGFKKYLTSLIGN